MSAQVEEVVVDSDLVDAQHVAPDFGDLPFRVRARQDDVFGRQAALSLWGGQRPAIALSAGRQRQPIQADEGRRHHVIGEPLLEKISQFGGGRRPLAGRDQPSQQTGLPTWLAIDPGNRFPDSRVGRQRAFYFTQFDPKPADLHLVVQPLQVLDSAVGQPPAQVAGLVEPRVGGVGKRVGNEVLGGQFGTFPVTPR